MKTKIKVGDYIFWSYDLFPYMLGGEVTKPKTEDGRYYVGSYGFYPKPLFSLPKEKGIKLKEKLQNLEQQRREMEKKIKDGFMMERNVILAEFGVEDFEK